MAAGNQVMFFDTTLRDGEQSPGVRLNPQEKLEIAKQLARLKIDVIEAGFPVASEGDFEGVSLIAKNVKGPIVAALARANNQDIDVAARAIAGASKQRIHTFISTSPTHLKYQLKMTPAQVLRRAIASVKRAKGHVKDVEFSAMDATRSETDYLVEIFEAAIDAGATVINVPDTVGYALPEEYAALMAELIERVKGANKVTWSVHCHDDLGLAVANSLAAVNTGARQVECAINGLGERAGNAALEEIAMALHVRRDLSGLDIGLNIAEIGNTSRKVSRLTGYSVPRNKAVVGANAFQHESGIHQDGVLKERSTYEIMKPEMIGHRTEQIVLGKHSGRHAVKSRFVEMGFHLKGAALDRAFKRFKEVADAKRQVTDRDLEAIANFEMGVVENQFKLERYQSFNGIDMIPVAAVTLSKNGEVFEKTSKGDGQVDALCNAISRATGFEGELVAYHVEATTEGTDAQGEVLVTIEDRGETVNGRGLATDVIEASARAFLNAINRLYQKRTPATRRTAAKKKAARKPAAKKSAPKKQRAAAKR